jgi:hypothetical protein
MSTIYILAWIFNFRVFHSKIHFENAHWFVFSCQKSVQNLQNLFFYYLKNLHLHISLLLSLLVYHSSLLSLRPSSMKKFKSKITGELVMHCDWLQFSVVFAELAQVRQTMRMLVFSFNALIEATEG